MNFDIEKMLAEQSSEEVLAAIQEEITRVLKEREEKSVRETAIKKTREDLKEALAKYMATIMEEPLDETRDMIEDMDDEFLKIETVAGKMIKLKDNKGSEDALVNFVRGLFQSSYFLYITDTETRYKMCGIAVGATTISHSLKLLKFLIYSSHSIYLKYLNHLSYLNYIFT